jgi:hypothetical protein
MAPWILYLIVALVATVLFFAVLLIAPRRPKR